MIAIGTSASAAPRAVTAPSAGHEGSPAVARRISSYICRHSARVAGRDAGPPSWSPMRDSGSTRSYRMRVSIRSAGRSSSSRARAGEAPAEARRAEQASEAAARRDAEICRAYRMAPSGNRPLERGLPVAEHRASPPGHTQRGRGGREGRSIDCETARRRNGSGAEERARRRRRPTMTRPAAPRRTLLDWRAGCRFEDSDAR